MYKVALDSAVAEISTHDRET